MKKLISILLLLFSLSSIASTTINISNPGEGHLGMVFQEPRENAIKRHINQILMTFGCDNINYSKRTTVITGTASCDEEYQVMAKVQSTGMLIHSDYLLKIKVFQLVNNVRVEVVEDTYEID